MRNFLSAILVLALAGFAVAQTGTTAHKSTTAKPATAKPAATTPAPKQPIQAIFQTTAGDINCTLFPDKAPITVANFIGLATGTKDWKNPSTGATMHNRPLYDGTIFHRVIPNFMIQGGDPLGNGSGSPGYSFRDEQSDLTFDRPAASPWPTVARTPTARSSSSPKFPHLTSTATTTSSDSAITTNSSSRSPALPPIRATIAPSIR